MLRHPRLTSPCSLGARGLAGQPLEQDPCKQRSARVELPPGPIASCRKAALGQLASSYFLSMTV